jgi:2-haloacid dehalogenase
MEPAHRLGIPRIWINRQGERPRDPSILQETLPDLHGLLAVVEKIAPS